MKGASACNLCFTSAQSFTLRVSASTSRVVEKPVSLILTKRELPRTRERIMWGTLKRTCSGGATSEEGEMTMLGEFDSESEFFSFAHGVILLGKLNILKSAGLIALDNVPI
jgi:hypothetical protein